MGAMSVVSSWHHRGVELEAAAREVWAEFVSQAAQEEERSEQALAEPHARHLRERASQELHALAEGTWLEYVKSARSGPSMELLLHDVLGLDYARRDRLTHHLWPSYHLSGKSVDLNFVYGVLLFGRYSRGPVSLCDMMLSGCPLIFVNAHFTAMCGFSRRTCITSSSRLLS